MGEQPIFISLKPLPVECNDAFSHCIGWTRMCRVPFLSHVCYLPNIIQKLQRRWLAKSDVVSGKVHIFGLEYIDFATLNSYLVQVVRSMCLTWREDPLRSLSFGAGLSQIPPFALRSPVNDFSILRVFRAQGYFVNSCT